MGNPLIMALIKTSRQMSRQPKSLAPPSRNIGEEPKNRDSGKHLRDSLKQGENQKSLQKVSSYA